MIKKSVFSKIVFLFLLSAILFSCDNGNQKNNNQRTKVNINADWLYLENDTQSLNEALKNTNWKNINLPHSWNALDATDLEPGYRRTGSWYKKDLEIPSVVSGQSYQLYFEGVNITCEVYVNGEKVGGHLGGYIGFSIDVSKAIHPGSNEILVRADNGYNPEVIPSQKSDFFIFGGITRDVWLETLPENHLSNLKITTPQVSHANAELKATVAVNSADTSNLKVKASLLDIEGNSIKTSLFDITNNKRYSHP